MVLLRIDFGFTFVIDLFFLLFELVLDLLKGFIDFVMGHEIVCMALVLCNTDVVVDLLLIVI